jgi:uncharacterized linocin/CFP29 family protein
MDFLKRELAPVTDSAWEIIREQAVQTLNANLSARKMVDVVGPKGLEYAAVNLGRLVIPQNQPGEGISYGLRKVLPLVEVRVQLELDRWELDNADRGARDVDVDPVIEAARKLATFEEVAVYTGFEPGAIQGLVDASPHPPIPLGPDANRYPEVAARAMLALRTANVDGPYALALGPDAFRLLEAECLGYPASKRVESLLGGPIVLAPSLDGGVLVSRRGGDFELVLGQDVSLGYETHDPRRVRLFLTESFTFRVLNREAVVRLPMA